MLAGPYENFMHQQTLLRLLGAPEHQEHRSAGTASAHPGMTSSALFGQEQPEES